jgi:hypothetical protein
LADQLEVTRTAVCSRVRNKRGALARTARAAVLFATVIGCGSDTALLPLAGNVTFQGEPVASGEITFQPVDPQQRLATAPIVDGKYRLDPRFGAAPGEYTVAIRAYRAAAQAGPGNPYAPDAEATEQYVPRQFNDATTLRITASAESLEHDFNLE